MVFANAGSSYYCANCRMRDARQSNDHRSPRCSDQGVGKEEILTSSGKWVIGVTNQQGAIRRSTEGTRRRYPSIDVYEITGLGRDIDSILGGSGPMNRPSEAKTISSRRQTPLYRCVLFVRVEELKARITWMGSAVDGDSPKRPCKRRI